MSTPGFLNTGTGGFNLGLHVYTVKFSYLLSHLPQDPHVTFILPVVHFLLGMQEQQDKSLAFLVHISVARNKVSIKQRRKRSVLKEWTLNNEIAKWRKEQIASFLPLFITALGLQLKILPIPGKLSTTKLQPQPLRLNFWYRGFHFGFLSTWASQSPWMLSNNM